MCLCEIAVIIQYRLAAFGLLPTPTFSNGAITDVRSALQWVQRSIHLFGGDPGRVTIWGQSSGGGSILHLLAAEARSRDAPLWRSSIVSSPYLVPMGKCDTGYFKVCRLSAPISVQFLMQHAFLEPVPCFRRGCQLHFHECDQHLCLYLGFIQQLR